jgi:hypothetical protein
LIVPIHGGVIVISRLIGLNGNYTTNLVEISKKSLIEMKPLSTPVEV